MPTKPRPVDTVVTADEAAALMGLSSRRVRELLEAGAIEGRRTGDGRTCVWLVSRDSALAHESRPRGRPKAS